MHFGQRFANILVLAQLSAIHKGANNMTKMQANEAVYDGIMQIADIFNKHSLDYVIKDEDMPKVIDLDDDVYISITVEIKQL